MSQKHYEVMVIFTPVLSLDEFKLATQNLTNQIKTLGGTIVAEDAWGLRSLAYPIRKKTTGLYYVAEYATEGNFNNKFEIAMNRDENIMRHMITVLDKHAIQYNDRKRKGIKVAPKVKSTEGETENNQD
jgi:small subunit ribosomal protein S6